jgi:hypothetical protein
VSTVESPSTQSPSMPTLLTDPRSGGNAKSSGVNVLPSVAETWTLVRNDGCLTNWLIASFDGNSKTNVTVIASGQGGIEECASRLLDTPCYGGVRLSSGRFVSFFYVPDGCSPMSRGRASMYKNGTLDLIFSKFDVNQC